MTEVNNKIEMTFLKKDSEEKKEEDAKPKRRPEEKSALKSSNKSDAKKSPVQRVKIAPYAYVEVRDCDVVCYSLFQKFIYFLFY